VEGKRMDFNNRGPQQPHTSAPTAQTVSSLGPTNSHKNKIWEASKPYRIAQLVLIFCVVVVLVGLLVFLVFGNGSTNEGKYVQTTKLQAVFLNTGQVYFGNIKTLNNDYLVLDNIYYLQTANSSSSSSSSSANTSVSLVKLGCELHAPLDQMIINRAQVTFWENLSPSGQVAKAVATFEKENPNGQKCSTTSSSSSSSGTSGTATTPQSSTTGSASTDTTGKQ
jgi:hypothetical protein